MKEAVDKVLASASRILTGGLPGDTFALLTVVIYLMGWLNGAVLPPMTWVAAVVYVLIRAMFAVLSVLTGDLSTLEAFLAILLACGVMIPLLLLTGAL